MWRKHSDAVIAALIMLGAAMWLARIANRLFELDDTKRLGVLFVAGWMSAQLARRVLVDMELGTTVVASVVAMALVIGIYAQHRYHEVELAMVIPFGVAAAGALLGAVTSRRRPRTAPRVWGVVAGGFAGFGAMLAIAGGIGLVTDGDYIVISALVGGALGAFGFVLATDVAPAHCAAGCALVFASTSIDTDGVDMLPAAVGGMLIGWVMGAIGAGIGGRVRDRLRARPDLPAATVR